jgi:glycyl-tRNA synthetase
MILCDAYDEEYVPSEKKSGSSEGTASASAGSADDWRTVLRFHPSLAPVTVAVLPLMKKDGLAELAQDIRRELKEDFAADYDQSGAIGRRYRRQDEAGTPFCVTIDYQSKDDGTVTLRFRDSMEQVRVPKSELTARLRHEIKEYKRIK